MSLDVFSRITIIVSIICTVIAITIIVAVYINKIKYGYMRFKIYDDFHGTHSGGWVYSDHPSFDGKLSDFFSWVEQHQDDYSGVKFVGWKVKNGSD